MNENNHSAELKTAIEAVKLGAEKALEYFNNDKNLGTTIKADDTPVTIADPMTEEVIKKHILSQFPEANILGEESGGTTDHESFWIIDPIDGTRVYARGIKTWAILLAYYSKGEFLIGVSYFPSLGELYYAEKGKGAFLNDELIKVSDINPLNKAMINSGNPKYFKNKGVIPVLVERTAVTRGYETTYADCLVASGKMDISVDPYAQLWDFAPFATILPEAGGSITNLHGNPLQLTDRGCVMSNNVLHEELMKILTSD
jgi:histidinol phosphatase-like enzyme (inositol monophosphatase family)